MGQVIDIGSGSGESTAVPQAETALSTLLLILAFSLTHRLFALPDFVVDAPATEVDPTNLLEDERAIYRDHRWWTVAEIEQLDEIFLPPGLRELLRSIIVGTHPHQPIVLR